MSDGLSKNLSFFSYFSLRVRSTPCECCSRSHHRSGPGSWFQVNSAVSLDRTVNITFSHHFFCSWDMTQHISHTRGGRSYRPARYLSGRTHSQVSKRCIATGLRVSSSISSGHCVLSKDVNPKRLGSENNEGNTTGSHLMTPLVLLEQNL